MAAYSNLIVPEALGNPRNESAHVGLCADCQHVRPLTSDRGSLFYLCGRSANDSMFPKYPRLPVIVCSGYDPNGQPSNSGLDFKFDGGKNEGEV